MATITVLLKTEYDNKENAYPIIVRLRHGKQKREIPVGFKVKVNQWSGAVIKHPDKEIINAAIADKVSEINKYFTTCKANNKPIYLKMIGRPVNAGSFTDYLLHRGNQYKATGQHTMAGRVLYAHKELTGLFGTVLFPEITVDLIRKYYAYLKEKNHANTIHKRFSMLRQLFTNAVNEGVYIGANAFTLFKVNQEPVNKEKLSVKEITQLEKVKLQGGPEIARDLFLLSYYAKGMRFENCVLLQWKDIRKGRIYIVTNKGKKHISIEIHERLKKLLDKYKGTGFVFPYIDHIPDNKRMVLDRVNVIVNHDLKIVAAAAGVTPKLSFHLSRHSLAYHLKQKGVSIGAIKDILGHSATSTTERYLKAMDDTALDGEMGKVYG